MSIEMDVTKMIINEKLNEEESFSLDELLKDISSQGGSNYVAEDLTVKQYLDTLKEGGLLSYNPSTNRYTVLKNPNSKN